MKLFTSLSISVIIASLIVLCFPTNGEHCIYDDVLRLHVIAESDSTEDQSLKLKVRDAVLNRVSEAVAECKSFDEAYTEVNVILAEIAETAQECVYNHGSKYSVDVKLGKEKYPRRYYESVTLPSGTYNSLRVTIGSGEGKNWWCILFPGICTSFAEAKDNTDIPVGLTVGEYRMITGSDKIKIKFKILEIIEELVQFTDGLRNL